MICNNCKTQNPDGNTSCIQCGASLDPFVTADSNSFQQQYVSSGNDPFFAGENPYFQPQSFQQPYKQSMTNYPTAYNYQDDDHVTTLGWIGIWAINLIPVVGSLIYLVLMFVWAFGDTRKKSLKTYARSQLILCLVGIVLLVIMFGVMGITFSDLMNDYPY